jgi:hypothetical protein
LLDVVPRSVAELGSTVNVGQMLKLIVGRSCKHLDVAISKETLLQQSASYRTLSALVRLVAVEGSSRDLDGWRKRLLLRGGVIIDAHKRIGDKFKASTAATEEKVPALGS